MIDGLVQRVGHWQKLVASGSYRRSIADRAAAAAGGDEPELHFLRERVAGIAGFVDAGAAAGLYLAHLMDTDLEFVAFEPNPRSAQLLRRAFPEVELHQVALGEETDRGTLMIPRTNSGREIGSRGSLLENTPAGMTIRRTTVPIRRLDSFDLPAGRLMLKIDVEGAELSVLAGATATMERVDVALIECEERHAPGAPYRLVDHMGSLGFDGWVVAGSELVPMSEFRVEVHQSPDLVAALTVRGDSGPISAYANNFLFVRQGR